MTSTSKDWQDGFIINTQVVHQKGQERVRLWITGQQGTISLDSPPQSAIAFIERENLLEAMTLSNDSHDIQFIDSHLHTFKNKPVAVLKANTQKQLRSFEVICRDAGIEIFEADIKPADRYIMERFVYGSVQYRSLPELKIRPGTYRPSLRYIVVDIECDENGQLYSIGCDDGKNGWVWMRDDAPETFKSNEFTYLNVASELHLLKAWVDFIRQYDPDVITGWNVKQFDCRVLTERASLCGISLNIGRDGQAMTVRKTTNEQYWVEVPGRAVVDGIESLKTMTFHFSSFTLNYVAEQLLGEQKLIHDDDQLGRIKHLFIHDKPTLARYNWMDCRLVARIIEKTNLINFLVLRSCLTGLPLSRPGGSVAAFINNYLPHVHRAGYVSPNRPHDGGLASPGGYVMTSSPGMYEHILVLDFKSLYPSIIRTFLIDPVGLVEGLKCPEDSIPGFKDAFFSRDKHFLPDIIDQLWQQRDEAKKDGDEARSRAIKIIMNSFYGVLGSGGCPFYDTRLASSITLRGHEIMQTTKAWIEEMGYTVIYGDTDSTFVWIKGCNDAIEVNNIGRQVASHINAKWKHHINAVYNTECFLEIEFETHFARFFMPTIRHSELGSKKRYAGMTGPYHGEKLIFKGLESVRSDWTQLAKEFQTTLYQKVFKQEPVEDYIKHTVSQVSEGLLDAKLIYQKRLRKPVDAYIKTRPPHVKAAIIANDEAKSAGKPIPYPNKSSVQYVISTNGPVPVGTNVPLDYTHYIDKQLKPIADSILPHLGLSFDAMTAAQLRLFE
ncbi:DNA polymerase II [Alteromonas sediminis]|uniref:DNA polymerase n=1 Tax=Alteromonas sediminis TaxID=2259342 RepID=A0A3N5Y668_9ALTE|nr:DNA polymerase II [Alteromonas sediminis]